MGTTQIFLVGIPLMVLATQLARLAPLFFKRIDGTGPTKQWLAHVPIAVLTALVVPEFFTSTSGALEVNKTYLVGAGVALVVGLWKRNLLMTVFAGVVIVALVRLYTS